jgi:serine/threonine protein kinase
MLITDFGLSKDMDTGTTTWASATATTLAESSYGTISWTAPEIFKDRQVFHSLAML